MLNYIKYLNESINIESHPHTIVTVQVSNEYAPTLIKMLEDIKALGNPGHSFSIIIDPPYSYDKGGAARSGFDGDGSDRIYKITSEKINKEEK